MTLAQIGRFQVERVLGSGTFATVWLARDEDLDAWVAIKLLAENWSMNADARRRFIEEARALRRLDSDRIVRVYEFGHLEDGRPYMVMEFADRGTLEDRMRLRAQLHQPFPVDQAVELAVEVAECLVSVHAHRLVHRDVKPSNVLFRRVPEEHRAAMERNGLAVRGERTLLGDFGIARRLEGILGQTMVVGSPQYMAPEQGDPVRAGRVDFRSDIYSAAVILYEMIAGRLPFGFDSMADVRQAGADVEPVSVQEMRPEVSAGLAALLARGLARDPDQRVGSGAEWRDELELVRGEGVVRHPVEVVPDPLDRTDGGVLHPVEVRDPIDVPLQPVSRSDRTQPIPTSVRTRMLDGKGSAAEGEVAAQAHAEPAALPPPLPPVPATPSSERPPAPPDGVSRATAAAQAPADQTPPRMPVRFPAFVLMLSAAVAGVAAFLPWRETVDGPRAGVALVPGLLSLAGAVVAFVLGLRTWRSGRRWEVVLSAFLCLLLGVAAVVLSGAQAFYVRRLLPGFVLVGAAGGVAFLSAWWVMRRVHRHRQEQHLAQVMAMVDRRTGRTRAGSPTGPGNGR